MGLMERILRVTLPKALSSVRGDWPAINAVKLAIVAGVIGAIVLLGLMAPRIDPLLIILATALIPMAVFIMPYLGKLEFGAFIILLTAGFVRIKLPTGTETDIVASLIVATGAVGLWILKMVAVDKRVYLKPATTNIPVLGFIATCVISYLWSNVFRDVLVVTWGSFPFVQLAALLVMLVLPAVFLFVSNTVDDVKWLKRMSWLVIFIGALTIFVLILPIPGRTLVLSLVGVADVGMGLLSLWVVTIAYALALFNRRMQLWVRLLLLGLAGAWMYFGTGQLSRWMSLWLPPLCAIYAITFMRSKRLFLVLVVVALVFANANFDRLYDRVFVQSQEEGDFQRWGLWQTNLELVSSHPLFGTGPAGYAVYYMTYHPENARSTHNNYFDIVAQTGIVGFAFFLWFVGALGATAYKLCLKLKGQRDFEEAFACAMLGGGIGALAAMMLGDWILPFVYNVGLEGFDHAVYAWLFLGGLGALHHIVEGRADKSATMAESVGGK
jgi:O-antigen ligase